MSNTSESRLNTIGRIKTDSDGLSQKENRNLDHLPGDYGWPLIGQTFKFLRAPRKSQQQMYKKFGNVIKSSVLFQRSVVLLGPEANELVMLDKERNFSSRMGWHFLLDKLFRNGLMLRDFEDHRAHRRVMNVAFKPEALKNYLDTMNPVIEQGTSGWGEVDNFLFYDGIKEVTLNVAAVVFVGMELGKEADKVNQAFVDTVNASLAIVRYPVPGLALWKGIRGREYLIEFFSGMIEEKRKLDGRDMFSQFCRSHNDEGQYYSDKDIVDHMIFLMMAAHDTTTSAVTTMVYALGKHPEWQVLARAECERVYQETGNDHLGFEDQDKLELVERIFKEALRMYTPVPSIPRRAIRAFEFEGHKIPANTSIGISPAFTHYMPEIWDNPEAFEPDRFSPQRAEDKKHAFAWVPFSKGAHMCIGLHFAYMQVKAVMYQMLRQYEFSLPENYELNMLEVPIPKPKDRLPIDLKRI